MAFIRHDFVKKDVSRFVTAWTSHLQGAWHIGWQDHAKSCRGTFNVFLLGKFKQITHPKWNNEPIKTFQGKISVPIRLFKQVDKKEAQNFAQLCKL